MSVEIRRELCICCGLCEIVCPVNAIVLEKGKAVVDETVCIDCNICIYKCLYRAITSTAND